MQAAGAGRLLVSLSARLVAGISATVRFSLTAVRVTISSATRLTALFVTAIFAITKAGSRRGAALAARSAREALSLSAQAGRQTAELLSVTAPRRALRSYSWVRRRATTIGKLAITFAFISLPVAAVLAIAGQPLLADVLVTESVFSVLVAIVLFLSARDPSPDEDGTTEDET